MSEGITRSTARNIYIGGSLFSILILVGLTFDTVKQMPKRDHRENLTEAVIKGKGLWEKNNCVGCHTIMGEGAYYAPELGNVYDRYGAGDPTIFKAYLSGWMAAMPTGIEGRRQMPQFNLTEEEVNDMAEFLIWTSKIDDQNWPPNVEG